MIAYTTSFDELAKNNLQYNTIIWMSISLLLVLAWGVGIIMLLYLPFKKYVLHKYISSYKSHVTSTQTIYKVYIIFLNNYHFLRFSVLLCNIKLYLCKTCFITIFLKFSAYTVTLCHWATLGLAYSFGSSLSNGLLLFQIPPVTICPLLSFFCNGANPTYPTIIAYTQNHQ